MDAALRDVIAQSALADLDDWGVDGDREWPWYRVRGDDAQAPDEHQVPVTRDHLTVSSTFDPVASGERA